MPNKKMFSLLLLFVILAVFTITSVGFVQAAERPAPHNQPPYCYPIEFLVPGYWGMECLDVNHNIVSAVLRTKSPFTLVWDNSYAQMIVELEENTEIHWQVCDSFKACQHGSYP